MAVVSKTITLDTKHNHIELETVDENSGKVKVSVKEKCDEENNYEVGREATLRLGSYEVEELIEALSQFIKLEF